MLLGIRASAVPSERLRAQVRSSAVALYGEEGCDIERVVARGVLHPFRGAQHVLRSSGYGTLTRACG